MAGRWSLLSNCATSAWHPGFGDADITGFVLLALYTAAGLLAFVIIWRAPFPIRSHFRERLFWVLLLIFLVALTVNKQLDLHVFLINTARCLAKAEGWYENRRLIQREVAIALLVVTFASALILALLLRGTLNRNLLPLAGGFGLLLFSILRVSQFNHIAQALSPSLISSQLYRGLEGLSLLLLIFAQWRILIHPTRQA